MKDDLFSEEDDAYRGGRDSLFAWTVAILLLAALVIAAWITSFHIFGHPEDPVSYTVLQKLGKIDPPKRFELTAAPRGEFLPPEQLYERFSGMPDWEIEKLNQELLRNYIRNYRGVTERVLYVIGNFNILDAYVLDDRRVFESGVVALAQSTEFPAVLIEHVYPATAEVVPVLQRVLRTGLDIQLRRTFDLCSILNINRLEDGRMILTVVPLIYGSYELGEGGATVRLEPPSSLNLRAGWPVIDDTSREAAEARYAQYRRDTGLGEIVVTFPGTAAQSAAADGPPLPVIASATPTPRPSPTPEVRPATPLEVPVLSAEPEEDPFPDLVVADIPSAQPPGLPSFPPPPLDAPDGDAPSAPVQALAVEAAPTPLPPAPAEPPAPPLQPFLASTGQTSAPAVTASGSWPTYSPGQMPRGRLLDPSAASRMADSGPPAERSYLQGNFEVTAARGRTAVLRPRGGNLPGIGGRSQDIRIVVEFPPNSTAPMEGTRFSRSSDRPFQITDVRRGSDGQINVFAREVTIP